MVISNNRECVKMMVIMYQTLAFIHFVQVLNKTQLCKTVVQSVRSKTVANTCVKEEYAIIF